MLKIVTRIQEVNQSPTSFQQLLLILKTAVCSSSKETRADNKFCPIALASRTVDNSLKEYLDPMQKRKAKIDPKRETVPNAKLSMSFYFLAQLMCLR